MAGPGGWRRTGEFSGIGGCRKIDTQFHDPTSRAEAIVFGYFQCQVATTVLGWAG